MRKLLCLLLLLPGFLQAQTIHITASGTTICTGTMVHFTATDTGVTSPHFRWKVNGTAAGIDSVAYSTATLTNGDTIKCLLTNSAGDTVYAVSNNVIDTVQVMPSAILFQVVYGAHPMLLHQIPAV